MCIVLHNGACGRQGVKRYCFLFAADVRRLEQGLEPQRYDAFLLFAEEDQDFAMQILDRMESDYGLKVPKRQ
jgi:hypothetical protein